ncbi:MAG: hypothetical protein R3D57_20410 [Hyphomicrobiaceae bacterium]
MAMIVTPDQTIVSISLAAQADLRTCGLEGAPGRTCLSLPEDILADHLTAIHNDSVTRFTSEYIAHWPTHSEHVRSDIRVMRMFKIPMAIDIYETMPVASSAHMNHRQQTI